MKVSGSTPLWMAARTLLTGQGDDFFDHLREVEKHFEVEEIHDLRVASRRFREALALFAPCYPPESFSRLVKKVKRVTRTLGTLRNVDEAILFFSPLAQEGESTQLQELLQLLASEREQAQKEVRRRLRSLPVAALLSRYRTIRRRPLIFEPGPHDPFLPITGYALDGLKQRAETVAELFPAALEEKEAVAQHRLRVAVKHLRYRLEIVAPLVTRDYDEVHAILKGYQDVLGKMHDLDVFSEMVRERIHDHAEQAGLLEMMAAKRAVLFASFQERSEQNPLPKVGERALKAL